MIILKRTNEVLLSGGTFDSSNVVSKAARRSFASVLKRSGVNIAYISESLGHSDLRTTENYLASFEREEREKISLLHKKIREYGSGG